MDLSHLSDRELVSNTEALIGSQRELTARLVGHLAEIEERRLHLEAGFSSMFEFCIKKLRMSEGEAFRRINGARLSQRFPGVHSQLASGALNLSSLELLRSRLTEENHAELLAAASGKSKRDVEAILAERFPRSEVPSSIRQHIEPLSKSRFRVAFTGSEELVAKLERCRDLMSHANPSRDLAVVVERALDLLLADLEKRRLARTKRQRPASAGFVDAGSVCTARSIHAAKGGRITNAVRRRVFERDGLRCTFVSADGRRCEASALLELDHVEPKGFGGGNDVANLRVLCRAHNQLAAETLYGRGRIERCRHFRQQKRTRTTENQTRPQGEFVEQHAFEAETSVKVLLALKGLGFPDARARQAIAAAERSPAATKPLTLEQALRRALHFATAGMCGSQPHPR